MFPGLQSTFNGRDMGLKDPACCSIRNGPRLGAPSTKMPAGPGRPGRVVVVVVTLRDAMQLRQNPSLVVANFGSGFSNWAVAGTRREDNAGRDVQSQRPSRSVERGNGDVVPNAAP
jgi:hypothetical protein